MFNALLERHDRATREREFLFGQLTSCVVNYAMAHPKKPVTAADYMPSEWRRKKPRKRTTKDERQAVADQVRELFASQFEQKKR
jgi:hypothetical protein